MKENEVSLKEYFDRRFEGVDKTLEEIKTNHFLHLEKKVDRIFWFLLTTFAAIVVHAIGSAIMMK